MVKVVDQRWRAQKSKYQNSSFWSTVRSKVNTGAFSSYYNGRNVPELVCPATLQLFMDLRSPNLAGRFGTGTEKILRDPFPWKLIHCHSKKKKKKNFHDQIRIVVAYNIAYDVVDDVTSPMTPVTSWKCHDQSAMSHLGASALLWAGWWWLEMLHFCNNVQAWVSLGTPLAVC